MRRLVPLLLLVSCAAPQSEWRPLFNGRDLDGWCPVNCAPSTFTVRDGVLHCDGLPTGVLRTDRMYENFVLELDWRHLRAGGNSGLFVWSDPLPARGVPFTRSFEVQVMDGVETADYTSHGDIFSIWGAHFVPDRPHPKGWERCLPSEKRALPSPAWNHYRVVCVDGAIRLDVNGKAVSGGHGCTPRKGYICLESEGGEVEFRNLRIQELPAAKPALGPELVASADEGLLSLFNGLDLSGWHGRDGGAPDPAHWQVRDEKIWTDGMGGPLILDAAPKRFVASLDWRREKASSMVAPLLAFGWQADAPEATREGWHRLRLEEREGAWIADIDGAGHARIGRPEDDSAGKSLGMALILDPESMPTEFMNIFLRPLD